MSAESQISSLLTLATLAADDLAADADSLVNEAVGALSHPIEWPLPPGAVTSEVGVNPGGGGGRVDWFNWWVDEEEKPPPVSFPAWPTLDFGTPPNTQDLDGVALDLEAPEFPELTLPDFSYRDIPEPPGFTTKPPDIDDSITLPETPPLDLPATPRWKTLRSITTPQLSFTPPTLAPVEVDFSFDPELFSQSLEFFKGLIFGGDGEELKGLDQALTDLASRNAYVLDVLLPVWLETLALRFSKDARVTHKYDPVLAFDADLQTRLAERIEAERTRIRTLLLTDTSGWDRPQAAQVAMAAMAEQIMTAWAEQAASQFSTTSAVLIYKFFEFCGSLFVSMHGKFMALKTKEIELILESHKWALAYARQSLAVALSVYEATQFTSQGLMIQRGEAELAVAEAELKVALTRFQIADAQLQVQQAQQDQDTLLIQQYSNERSAAQAAVTLYAEQVAATRSELEIKKLPLLVFESQVKGFAAQVDAHEARVNARVAEIDGNIAKMKGEEAKVAAFEAKAKAFENNINLQQQVVAGQAERNAAIIEEYETRIKAVLAPLTQEALANEYELTKYQVLADDALADAKLALAKAKADLDWTIQEQAGLDKAYEFTQKRALDLMDVELKRLDAIASVNAEGANLVAGMAEGAMTVMNSIANVIYNEEV